MLDKVKIRRLQVKKPPLDVDGGRILTAAGEIAQIVSGVSFKFLAYIEFNADRFAPRGNHFHRNKIETFYVIKGRLEAVYEDVETKQRFTTTLETGDLVTVLSGCAHVYYAHEYTQLVEFATGAFDASDTYPYHLSLEHPVNS